MAEAACCPKCGTALAPNAPRGICPLCLFQGALEATLAAGRAPNSADRPGDRPPAPDELAADFPELEIIRLIGRGGMGMVYEARHRQLDRKVALKILSPAIARDPAFAERFAREARLMALLTHPHVVSIYDFGTRSPGGPARGDMPVYYFLMEFVDGLTLRQLLDSGELAAPQALAIVPQICEALQYAHDKGVVHRDVKPENILVDRQGNVKIADFGLAKLMGLEGHDVTISATGQVLGTLHYMAPEQMERPAEVDHRADIYSLGVVFYQMLTGELPLGRFAPPSRRAPVDARLDEVVLRALEKEPARRYQQASALRSQIETIASTPAESPDELNPPQQRRSWLSRARVKSRLVPAVVLSALICLALAFLASWNVLRTHGSSSGLSLADFPDQLRRVSTDRVVEAGLEKPLSPWAWQELERRTITTADADRIMEGLIDWLLREHPGGLSEPLHWLDRFLQELDRRGLIGEQQKIDFLETLQGDLRGRRAFRLREGSRQLMVDLEWRWHWDGDLLGLTLLNELESVTIDGQPVPIPISSANWDWPRFSAPLQLPRLPAGKHALRVLVLSALVPATDLVGLKHNARSTDWPTAKKRWIRTLDAEVTVFPEDVAIISATRDPALDPVALGLKVEPITIHGSEGRQSATLKFDLGASLPVPIGFDVSLRIGGQTVPCKSLWAIRTREISMGSEMVLSTDIPPIGANVKEADVIMTPNAKLIELRPEVDRFWGEEVVFRNVSLRRLDIKDMLDPSMPHE